jgi:hypothetical protein
LLIAVLRLRLVPHHIQSQPFFFLQKQTKGIINVEAIFSFNILLKKVTVTVYGIFDNPLTENIKFGTRVVGGGAALRCGSAKMNWLLAAPALQHYK